MPGPAPDPTPSGHPSRLKRLWSRTAGNAREHPYISALFGFWAFGYTMMVPQILGSRFMPYISEKMGGAPEMLFVAFGALLINVLLFAFIVPFCLWLLVCWALGKEE